MQNIKRKFSKNNKQKRQSAKMQTKTTICKIQSKDNNLQKCSFKQPFENY